MYAATKVPRPRDRAQAGCHAVIPTVALNSGPEVMVEKTRMCVCVCVCVCVMFHQSLKLLIGQISGAQSSAQVRFCVFLRAKKARISRTG